MTQAKVDRAKPRDKVYRHTDFPTLCLVVQPSGSKQWIQRLTVHGRRLDLGLGSATLVPLDEARQAAFENRRVARAGGDPRTARVPTFEETASSYLKENERLWRGEKTESRFRSAVDRYVSSVLGGIRVDRVEAPQLRELLKPVNEEKPATAKIVAMVVNGVLNHAIALGHRLPTTKDIATAVLSDLPARTKLGEPALSRGNPRYARPFHQTKAVPSRRRGLKWLK